VTDSLGARPPGATPLDEDELGELIPTHLSTRRELDEFEHSNILEAERWLLARNAGTDEVLSESFARELHRRMFDRTWRWAGRYRRSGKSIGNTPWELVQTRLIEVLENARAQLAAQVRPADELAARNHHALVAIHPFADGNGRWTRRHADELLRSLGRPPFNWGASLHFRGTEARTRYLAALREADAGKFDALMAFVRS
jgi:Fic-DOC domain mobile mystery protein B